MHIRLSVHNIICMTNVMRMRGRAMPGFRIPKIPPTTNKTIRFPNDVIEDVEKAIVGQDCTFSAFVIAAVRNALEELKEEEDKEK